MQKRHPTPKEKRRSFHLFFDAVFHKAANENSLDFTENKSQAMFCIELTLQEGKADKSNDKDSCILYICIMLKETTTQKSEPIIAERHIII